MAGAKMENKVPIHDEVKLTVETVETENSSDAESDASDTKNYDDVLRVSLCLALDIERYLTRQYEIYLNKSSTITEDSISLTPACITTLRGSINRYKCTHYQNIYLSFAKHENRYDQLSTIFKKVLLHKAQVLSHSEFLRFCALYVLTAYDLKTMAGFEEAPDIVIDAIAEAITLTQQQQYLILWLFPTAQKAEQEPSTEWTG